VAMAIWFMPAKHLKSTCQQCIWRWLYCTPAAPCSTRHSAARTPARRTGGASSSCDRYRIGMRYGAGDDRTRGHHSGRHHRGDESSQGSHDWNMPSGTDMYDGVSGRQAIAHF
jgi:hypothetical protein